MVNILYHLLYFISAAEEKQEQIVEIERNLNQKQCERRRFFRQPRRRSAVDKNVSE